MANYKNLQKILKISKSIDKPETLLESLFKIITSLYNSKNEREFTFLIMYYGLKCKSLTLESIGLSQEKPLTRERVRQVIDTAVTPLLNFTPDNFENPYNKSLAIFKEILGNDNFIRFEDLIEHPYFIDFKKNVKGLISFLNDSDIRQIAYRKKYYFYTGKLNRTLIVKQIQKENKHIRREETVSKMSLKSKTVTYVPNEVRNHLLEFSDKNKINLNPLYESILINFMLNKPYYYPNYNFPKTKSWKARKGKAQWQQIGIYINKNIFNKMKDDVEHVKNNLHINVSIMSFICQAFVWHYETYK